MRNAEVLLPWELLAVVVAVAVSRGKDTAVMVQIPQRLIFCRWCEFLNFQIFVDFLK